MWPVIDHLELHSRTDDIGAFAQAVELANLFDRCLVIVRDLPEAVAGADGVIDCRSFDSGSAGGSSGMDDRLGRCGRGLGHRSWHVRRG